MKERTRKSLVLLAVCLLAAAVAAAVTMLALPKTLPGTEQVWAANPDTVKQPGTGGVCAECGRTTYLITDASELAWAVKEAEGGGGSKTSFCYLLTADFDLTGWSDTGIGTYTEELSSGFTGHFDGGGHTIKYRVLDVAEGTLMGLFPVLNGATVENLNLVISQQGNFKDNVATGALCRHAQNSVIRRVSVEQNVSGGLTGGAGIAGTAVGTTFEWCEVRLAEGAEDAAYSGYGGIANRAENCTLTGCKFSLSVPGGEATCTVSAFGGIAAEGSKTRLDYCASTFPEGLSSIGESAEKEMPVAGILALGQDCTLQSCSALFQLTKPGEGTHVGGIAGILKGTAVLEGCETQGGAVLANGFCGGLVGMAQCDSLTMRNCRSEISSLGKSDSLLETGGGLIGAVRVYGNSEVAGCSADSNVYSKSSAGGLMGAVTFEAAGEAGKPIVFRVADCHSYAAEIAGDAYAGGAFGSFTNNGLANTVTQVQGCTALAKTTGKAYAGGFVGVFDAKEAGDGHDVFSDCHAYGDVRVTNQTIDESLAGGFVGSVHSQAENFRATDCTAAGSVENAGSTVETHVAGGFVGRDGWRTAADVPTPNRNSKYIRCTAYGSARGVSHGGGFMGWCVSNGMLFEDCAAYGDASSMNGCYAGGFVASGQLLATFTRCVAHGSAKPDVVASEVLYAGGLVGIWSGVALDTTLTFTGCVAYGEVKGYVAGGLCGQLGVTGKLLLTGCAAYGNVQHSGTGGGLVGSVHTQQSATVAECEAYGNVEAYILPSQSIGGNEAGGIVGYVTECGGKVTVSGCRVVIERILDYQEIGGIIGLTYARAEVLDCTSYVNSMQIVGGGTRIGGVVGTMRKSAAVAAVSGCKYTFKQSVFGGFDGVDSALSTEKNNTFLSAGSYPVNPKAYIACDKTTGNTEGARGIHFAFTFSLPSGSSYRVEELAISTDGGKYYTQLAQGGAALLPGIAVDGRNFTYTYAGVYVAKNVTIRITMRDSAGATMTRVF